MNKTLNKQDVPSLFAWAGGQKVFKDLFELFYQKVMKDAVLREVFKNMSEDHARHVAHFVMEVFGGPKLYTTSDNGSHATMVRHHVGKMLDDTKRRRWLELLLETADEMKLPDDPEFRSALVAYLEWGSRLAVINSNGAETTVNESDPMPVWGWGVPGGPYIAPESADHHED